MLAQLSTPRLTLRPARETDLDALQALWHHADVRRFLFDNQAVTRDRAQGVLDDALGVAERGLGLWMLELRPDGRQVGCIGLLPTMVAQYEPAVTGLVEPVLALDPAHWHRGYAVEALRSVLDYAFDTLGLDTIAGATDVPNVASRRMLERVGYRLLSERDGACYRLLTYTITREGRPGDAPVAPVTPKAESRDG